LNYFFTTKNIFLPLYTWLVVVILSFSQIVVGQSYDSLFVNKKSLDAEQTGQLALEIDNTTFFKDNEFNSTVQKGYTLPGFKLQLKGTYQPLSNLRIELGAHSIWFWGATRYPAFAYKGISTWKGQDYAHDVHVLPFLRAHLMLSQKASLILGDIYGGSNHNLIEPLFNPELNLSSDPETGIQFLFNDFWVNIDAWLDWITYIYKLDTHQESFVAGWSSKFLLNRQTKPLHFYLPFQLLMQHSGGEIGLNHEGVTTFLNASSGFGLQWTADTRYLKNISFETHYAVYKAVKGGLFDFRKGSGIYSLLSLQLNEWNIRTSNWRCNDFISIFGSPFFGAVSVKEEGMLYSNPSMLSLQCEYMKYFGKGCTLGLQASTYYYISGKKIDAATLEVQPNTFGNNSNFSFGICLRINPSFLIKTY